MKRIHYDGQSLVTGTKVAEALTVYAQAVVRMDTSASVEIPILEDDGSVVTHTLLLTASTALQSGDLDELEDEDDRFAVPDFPAIGGKAEAISTDDISSISVPIAD